MSVQPIPAGTPRISPYLVVADAARALAWYAEVLGATETMRIPGPAGSVTHAELRIGDSVVMVGQWHDGPKPGVMPKVPSVSLVHYVEDADAACARAVAAGGTLQRPVAMQPYGDRMGTVTDPFGHTWHLATHVEDVPPEEIVRRMSGG
jgi:PhnB protein